MNGLKLVSLVEYSSARGVATLSLNRPDRANAQNEALLHELDAAWTRAADDTEVKVIVLRAEGRHFSAGHDMTDWPKVPYGGEGVGIAPAYRFEHEVFFGYSRRWRDVPKPSIAAVQGACVGAGLMLCWPCDLIVASDDAYFADPVIAMGMPAVEYQAHTWEWGPRIAKEMLFTGRRMPAAEAHELGMVLEVVPREDLEATTSALASRIAEHEAFGLAQIKRATNLTLDIMGQHAALEASFDIHWSGHSHALSKTGNASPSLANLDDMRKHDGGRSR